MSYADQATCYNCGERGHLSGSCPAKVETSSSKTEHRMPSEDTIRQRILRLYQPATEAEMCGLVNTFRENYTPGAEHAMAPRMPPGFMALLQARQAHKVQESGIGAQWCADMREFLRVRGSSGGAR